MLIMVSFVLTYVSFVPLVQILQLGGQIAKNAKEATHLVLAKFSRTIKVMCAVNHVKHICCPEWVHESHRANTFLGEYPIFI